MNMYKHRHQFSAYMYTYLYGDGLEHFGFQYAAPAPIVPPCETSVVQLDHVRTHQPAAW